MRTALDAARLADMLGHSLTSTIVSWYMAFVHFQRGERGAAEAAATRVLELVDTYGFTAWAAEPALIVHAARGGNTVETVDALAQRLAGTHSTQWRRTVGDCLFAELYAQAGAPERALRLLIERGGDHSYYAAEVHRLEGEIRRLLAPAATDDAARCFEQALDLARRQDARSLALRAATSLASLRRDRDARAVLEAIYRTFTEGFDTRDLRAAKVLLDELGSVGL